MILEQLIQGATKLKQQYRGGEMASTFRIRIAVMMAVILTVISISSVLQADALPQYRMESADQAEESDSSMDWFGIFCCLLFMVVAVGFPIAVIIFITKIIQGSAKKNEAVLKRKDQRPYPGSIKPAKPIRIDISHGRNKPKSYPEYRSKPPEVKKVSETKLPGITKRKEPETEKEVIEMDLTAKEIEEEPRWPVFQRPEAMDDEEKDDFIVDRIMELQSMLKDGEIDKEMYDILKKRLMDQLED